MIYLSKHAQIVEILTKKPKHRKLRQELPDGERMTDSYLTLEFIDNVWRTALRASRDPERGAEEGREVEYYIYRADMMLWTSYFGHEEGSLEFPWEYDPPSQPRREPAPHRERVKTFQEEPHLRNRPGSLEFPWEYDPPSQPRREPAPHKERVKTSQEEPRLRNRPAGRTDQIQKERSNPHAPKHSERRNTTIIKNPNRHIHRALPRTPSSSLKQLPDARVFNAFEYTIDSKDFIYPHSWTAKLTNEFGPIYLPPHFIRIPPHLWGCYIGKGGHSQLNLNNNFENLVKISGERLDGLSRLALPEAAQCDVHGLFVQPVRRGDMNDIRIRDACEELAEQFLRSWISLPCENGQPIAVDRYWHIWVQRLGREPLILQLLKDRQNDTAQVRSRYQGTKRRYEGEGEDRPETQRRRIELLPEGSKERRYDRDFHRDRRTEHGRKGLELFPEKHGKAQGEIKPTEQKTPEVFPSNNERRP